jgi:hypothetical protein
VARLFITQREINFVSDLTKEFIKDVAGQKIFYYSVSETKSRVHDVYLESPEKVFENPVELECLIEFSPAQTKTDTFGHETTYDIKAWIHARDLIDKSVQLSAGDFFSYGEAFFEIVELPVEKLVFGQIEHRVGYEIVGKQARRGQFATRVFGPTNEANTEPDAVQTTFVQQRGQATNRLGETNDVRELQRQGILSQPLTGPKEVSKRGKGDADSSAFYGDE